jgi:hypothetical protein
MVLRANIFLIPKTNLLKFSEMATTQREMQISKIKLKR